MQAGKSKKKTILVLRPLEQALVTKEKLLHLGYEAVLCPLTKTCAVAPPPLDVEKNLYTGAIVTSRAALTHMPLCLRKLLEQLPFYCVGQSTASSLEKFFNKKASLIQPDAARLASQLNQLTSQSFVYLTGRVRSQNLEKYLHHRLTLVELYDTIAVKPVLAVLSGKKIDAVLVTSRLTAQLMEPLTPFLSKDSKICCLSHGIAQNLPPSLCCEVFISALPTEESLLQVLHFL